MTRAVVAKPPAGPEMPSQPQQLPTAFRAEVWLVHGEDSLDENRFTSAGRPSQERSKRLIFLTRLGVFPQHPSAPQRDKARKDPQRILVLSVPQATQLAPGASENGWQTSEIVGTVSSFSEDVSVYAQSPTIAKSLACRDTQGNENREQ